MIPTFVSPPASPRERGREFGAAHSTQIAANVEFYDELFQAGTGVTAREIEVFVAGALEATRRLTPSLAEEIEGLAEGASLPLEAVMRLNARTELGALGGIFANECSTVISIGAHDDPPIAIQSWDWYHGVADSWLLWTIEHPGGHVVQTMTEYGIVGKIGLNSAKVGILINILLHQRDAESHGVPVHVIARHALDEPAGLAASLLRIGAMPAAASTCISVVAEDAPDKTAVAVEVYPGGPSYVLPNDDGLILHTNHFLAAEPAKDDRAPNLGPGSYVRYEILRRRLRGLASPTAEQILEAMSSHLVGPCIHPPDSPGPHDGGTLATIQVDLPNLVLKAKRGGPCSEEDWTEAG